ncbi:helix-hairpin-helix domain-containing protein [Bacillus sp. DX1.1]|uniref:helix-hairpin-helix domain-containing protein n=1 Tax=unclassified Bacillus (in: firmicutes) TaxID=185979 RepID=UPI002570C7F8|nr:MULTISPECIES: helix-hairpin-helix domain-containing protein [unclassified Bacillus (in: firmicutes)]MDM5156525.1 helix-hairpin-helix domain-containing protein [Bacillus sp. DX1.1]WJE80790.1 helix-hairpin-helix domain-containing protein [Bacillus sp. DX3.1]
MMMNFQKKWFALLGAIGVVFLLFIWQTKHQPEQQVVKLETNEKAEERKSKLKLEESKQQKKTIMIDIKGAVHREGVYELQTGARVKDSIEKAGGFLPEADVAKVNLAQVVQDQMLLYVPKKGDQVQGTSPSSQQEGKIQINAASKEQLEKIPGIGPRKAENIMKYREQRGPFQKVEDLLEVDGIGEKSLEKIKDQIIIP